MDICSKPMKAVVETEEPVSPRPSLVCRDIMTTAMLIKETCNWDGLQVQRLSPLSSWREGQWRRGSHGVGV